MLILVAVLSTSVVAGCRVDTIVDLDVEQGGSGQVQVTAALDAEAAELITDLADALRVDDLREAGWAVEGSQAAADGSTTITASKAFATPEGAGEVLAEVSGRQGPFQDLQVTRRSSFLTTAYGFSGQVDLSDGVEGFSDAELRRVLEGSGFGLETAELEKATGAPVSETFRFEVRANLPGSVSAPEAADDGGGVAVWRPAVGEQTSLVATSRAFNLQRLAWLIAAALAALALVAVVVGNAVHARR